jgi:hypothetical protein
VSDGQDEPWRFVNFDEVMTEWTDRENPSNELELEVSLILMSLFDAKPEDWLARRTGVGWPGAWLGVMHLGTTGLSLAYVEDHDERVVTAVTLAKS